MYVGNRLVVVLNTHDAIREAFRNPDIAARPENSVAKKLKNGHGIVMGTGAPWYQQRKFTAVTFSNFGIGKSPFQDQIAEEVKTMAAEFNKFEEKPFDPMMLLTNATSNVICAVEKIGSGLFQVFIPAFEYLQSTIDDELLQINSEQKEFIGGIISDHKNTFDPDNLRDYVDVYLNEIQRSQGSPKSSELNDHNLVATLVQLFVAGTETTSTTMRWILLYLIANPDIQLRVQNEIDHVVGRNRLPRLADKSQMPYTQATIHDVQRISSVPIMGLPHMASRDTTVKGYTIPQGSIVVPNIFKVDHDPVAWNQPWELKPERFIDENGTFCPSENVMPFSVGRRSCIGENLAKMELFIFVSHLLHQFTFKKPKDETLSLEGIMGGSYVPSDYKVQAIRRI
ncbi:cytochrome P450 2U1-like [Amphiura filiformis]|uniref:cytochrome P450 2U1-like n=1 Tax=Amphiura filiformis TaxID=82378 RepID=UPI003B213009